jgi:hypothetical protein
LDGTDASGAPAGTGPGMDGGVENKGLASSRKEKVGTGDESNTLNEPGSAGDGGCGEAEIAFSSPPKEAGMELNPASVRALPVGVCAGVCRASGTAGDSTKSGRASARNENAGSIAGILPMPGALLDGAGPDGVGVEVSERASGAMDLSGAGT